MSEFFDDENNGKGDFMIGTVGKQEEILERLAEVYGPVTVTPEGFVAVNCGDGRGEVEPKGDIYAKKLGGAAGYSWDVAVLRELNIPDSLTEDWQETTIGLLPAFEQAKIAAEIHSDEHAEGPRAMRINLDKSAGKTGCGRMERADEIGIAAYKHADEIIEKMLQAVPGLFDNHIDRIKQIASINAQLVDRTLPDGRPFLVPGRKLMLELAKKNVPARVLAGDHIEEDAGYNLEEGTSNNNNKDQRHFGVDGWATKRLFEANPETLPFDSMDVLIQDVLISYATKLVLDGSLDDVVVRQ